MIYKYHILLKDIYDNMGMNWFTFSEYWEISSLEKEEKETDFSARNKMNSMVFYRMKPLSWRANMKPYLFKETWTVVSHLFPNVNKNKKRSNYWKITSLGVIEIKNVFKDDLKIKLEDNAIVAKQLLTNGGVPDSI